MTGGFAHARYRELLYQHGHGYPFWIPEPSDALQEELKAEGMRIGDVGILTEDGGFQYLWNAHLPASHPHNAGVPPDFVPLPLPNESHVRKINSFYPPNTVISSKSIKKRTAEVGAELQPTIVGGIVGGGASFDFSAEGNTGAILTLPKGGSRVDALQRILYCQYAVKHAESWYRYINQDLLLGIQSGALYLVTGTDKCSSWGVASFSKPSGSHSLRLKFIVSGATSSDVSVQNSWLVDFGVEHRTNVVDPAEKSQCVFARGFVITVRDNWLARMLGISVKTTELYGTRDLPSLVKSSRPYTAKPGYNLQIQEVPQSGQQKSPAAIIGEALLDENENASFAIVHDDDWIVPLQRGELPWQDNDFEGSFLGSLLSHAASLPSRVVNGVCVLADVEDTSPLVEEYSSMYLTLLETKSRLTVTLSTPYRTSPALQCSVAVLPKAGVVDLVKKVAREVTQQSSAIWANEDVEVYFWNFRCLYRQGAALASAELHTSVQDIKRSVSVSKPCGDNPHTMVKSCFSKVVMAQIGELNEALRLKSKDKIKRLGPICKSNQERAAWMLKRLQAWLRRQFVLRELVLPNELDDACGRTMTQLSQWIAALDGIVLAYEGWLSNSGPNHDITKLQLPTKMWRLGENQYRDLSSSITDIKEGPKTATENEWATVWMGKLAHKSLKKPCEVVAIKAFKWEKSSGKDLIHRCFREDLEVRNSLTHPNILPVYGVTTTLGDLPALVSPWCTTVKEYIRSRRADRLPVISITLDLFEQLLSALKHIHGQSSGGCHGNLKGTNLLVAQDGRLQLSDFGIRFRRDERIQLGTYPYLERASVPYLSPELITTTRMRPTRQSDMWAASCAFVEMLTGQAPYHGLRGTERIVREIRSGKAPIKHKPSEVTEGLWKLICKNFDQDPKKRLSASSMLTRLWILRYQENLVGESIGL